MIAVIPSIKLVASIKLGLAFMIVTASVFADTDPAELIPVVAISSGESSSITLDPENWSPNTPQPSVVVVFNKTVVAQADSDDCLDSNGTRVLVHDVDKSFCVHGWPICNTVNRQGLCPQAQKDLPNGAECSLLSTSTSNYGCLEKINAATPTSCHLRVSET
ncbi:hypothetical protein L915_05205 [Phytophthora nicotianae]|uniref:Uncharacterized protein n=2 Tax=Phytophthora nicotianae TaxID=4792 RepID=V9FKG2_PHYNI|nr:hypothetical protein F443_05344 [Phytophthora nicotianae P1569]ETK91141.1 hypothetical protein L915_05205 [Phytophthora nicotianae]